MGIFHYWRLELIFLIWPLLPAWKYSLCMRSETADVCMTKEYWTTQIAWILFVWGREPLVGEIWLSSSTLISPRCRKTLSHIWLRLADKKINPRFWLSFGCLSFWYFIKGIQSKPGQPMCRIWTKAMKADTESISSLALTTDCWPHGNEAFKKIQYRCEV
jgi:hypothetical protein